MNLYPPMLLSTGRVVLHSPMAFGISQLATPIPGPEEMTEQEWLEYCDKVRKEMAPKLKTCSALRCQDMDGRTA